MKYLSAILLLCLSFALFAQDFPRALVSLPWANGTSQATKIIPAPQGFQIEIHGDHVWDTENSLLFKDLKQHEKYTFTADVTSSRQSVAYLQVKLYKENKELQRLSSARNSPLRDNLAVSFDTLDATSVQLLVRTSSGPEYYGVKVNVANPTLHLGKAPQQESAKLPDIEIIPGYTVCSVYLHNLTANNARDFSSAVSFRKRSQPKWQPALPLCLLWGENNASGSIVKLEENTDYQVKIDIDDNGRKRSYTHDFKTLSPNVPVAKTIVLDSGNFNAAVNQVASGTPHGYIRYTCAPGFVLAEKDESRLNAVFNMVDSQYVILDGLKVRGGKRFAISIIGCHDIIVRNCDLAGFGRKGTQRTDFDGKYFNTDKKIVNMDGGLNVYATNKILIEKNYIHDARSTTNSWFHSHPAGMEAITIGETSRATIRFNDLVGSDLHRWNDTIEGHGNGNRFGSTFQDAEIYGNLLILGNDDGMELDGGQINCRFFYNRTEQHLCGVSTAPCLIGPSYVFQNLITNMGDVYGIKGASIKNNFSDSGKGEVFLFNNTITSGSGISSFGGSPNRGPERYPGLHKGTAFNNLIDATGYFPGNFTSYYGATHDYSLLGGNLDYAQIFAREKQEKFQQEQHAVIARPVFADAASGNYALAENSAGRSAGKTIPNFLVADHPDMGAFQPTENFPLPYRPLPFTTDVQLVAIPYNHGNYGTVSVKLIPDKSLTVPLPYTICLSDSDQYLVVSPMHGTLQPGRPQSLTLSVDKTKFANARLNHTVMLVRTPDGLSRHVTVHIDSQPDEVLLAQDRAGVIKGSITQEKGKWLLSFDLQTAGEYYLFGYFDNRAPGPMYKLSPGDEKPKRITFYGTQEPDRSQWVFLGGNSYGSGPNRPMRLEAGKHVFEISGNLEKLQVKLLQTALSPTPNLLLAPFQP